MRHVLRDPPSHQCEYPPLTQICPMDNALGVDGNTRCFMSNPNIPLCRFTSVSVVVVPLAVAQRNGSDMVVWKSAICFAVFALIKLGPAPESISHVVLLSCFVCSGNSSRQVGEAIAALGAPLVPTDCGDDNESPSYSSSSFGLRTWE